MKKLSALALIVGVLTASCSSHGGTTLPAIGSSAAGPPTSGAGLVRKPKSIVAAPPGWATTGTGVVALPSATDLGALAATTPIDIAVGLQLRNASALNSAVASGQVMSSSAFLSQYAPSADQVAATVSYLQSQGFTNISAAPNNILITASGTAATVQTAFNTTLHGVQVNGANYFANTTPAYVPSALGGNVIAVLGLTSVPGVALNPAKRSVATSTPTPTPVAPSPTPTPYAGGFTNPSPTPCTQNVNTTTGLPACPRFYDPQTYNITYDAGSLPSALNTEVAIFTVGDNTIAINDFRFNEAKFGLPQVPVNSIHVEPQSTDISGNDEWTLDMTYSQAMAYNVKAIDLYNAASFTFKDLTVALNRWASDNRAPIMNASIGGCEVFPYQSGDMLVGDEILVQAAAQGQTLFASTGDTGAYCGVGGVPPNGGVGGAPLVEYPASSPYAVAVGGTDLFTNVDGTYLGEQAWQSGGGGLSQFEYSPYWESPAQPVGTTPVGLSFRGLPDISMDAALETGALLYLGGVENIIGGTSLASPLAAGTYARMQSAHGNTLGFAPIRYYAIYGASAATQLNGPPETELIGPFHDILTGTNGLYTALPKFDYTTGLGSTDLTRLAGALH